MSDIEKPIADEATVLKGDNQVIIEPGDGSLGTCSVIVNGTKATFNTGKEVTVSDAQLDVLRNSGRKVTELDSGKKGKGKASPDGEAGAGEGSLAPVTKAKTGGKAKAAASKKPAPQPASNVNAGGNTTTATTPAVTSNAPQS